LKYFQSNTFFSYLNMGLIYTIELLMLNLGTDLHDWLVNVKSCDFPSRSVIWLVYQILKISQKLENSWINIVLKYQLQMTSFDPSRNFIKSIIHYCVAVVTHFSILNVSNRKFVFWCNPYTIKNFISWTTTYQFHFILWRLDPKVN